MKTAKFGLGKNEYFEVSSDMHGTTVKVVKEPTETPEGKTTMFQLEREHTAKLKEVLGETKQIGEIEGDFDAKEEEMIRLAMINHKTQCLKIKDMNILAIHRDMYVLGIGILIGREKPASTHNLAKINDIAQEVMSDTTNTIQVVNFRPKRLN